MFTANIYTPLDRRMVLIQLCRWKFSHKDCFKNACSPRKFSRSLKSEDKDKELQISPRGQGPSSRTTTLEISIHNKGAQYFSDRSTQLTVVFKTNSNWQATWSRLTTVNAEPRRRQQWCRRLGAVSDVTDTATADVRLAAAGRAHTRLIVYYLNLARCSHSTHCGTRELTVRIVQQQSMNMKTGV